jgi:hypothetical protein
MCAAAHPTQEIVVVGCDMGKIAIVTNTDGDTSTEEWG